MNWRVSIMVLGVRVRVRGEEAQREEVGREVV